MVCEIFEALRLSLIRFAECLARVTTDVVDFAMGLPSANRSYRGRGPRRSAQLIQFITDVVLQSETNVPALLVALVYVERARPHLSVSMEKWACERLFLGALIVASKVFDLLCIAVTPLSRESSTSTIPR